MSAVMTYASLVADLSTYTNNTNATFVAQIPSIIANAETQIARELKPQGFETIAQNTMQVGVSVYDKPNRWRETISFNIGTGTSFNTMKMLYPRAYEAARFYWPTPTSTDEPKFYSDYDVQHWLITPTPAQVYPFEVKFFALLQPLDAANQQNWLTQYAPDLLLYACLLGCAPFNMDDGRIPVWQAMYDRAAATLMKQDAEKITDRASNRAFPGVAA